MDRSPFDVEALARIANDLFRADGTAAPGPTEIPATAHAAPAAAETRVGPGTGQLPNVPAGGAAFAPSSPPTRPAYGRAVSPEVPAVRYGTGQPQLGFGPNPEGVAPFGFDPQAIPGFGPIPHVEDGFDVESLVRLGGGPDDFATPPVVPQDLASAAQSAGHAPTAFDATGARLPAAGSTVSPAAPALQPALGRSVSAEAPTVGYGTGQPGFGTAPSPGATTSPGAAPLPGVDPQDYFGASGLGPDVVPQSFAGFHIADLEKAAVPYLAPTAQPGLAAGSGLQALYVPLIDAGTNSRGAPPPHSPPPGAPGHPGPETLARTTPRNIDRPTPSGFAFTDAPHLGEFDEAATLRRSLNPQHGAPAIEGLADRPTALPEPYAADLQPAPAPSFYFLDDRMDYFANDVPRVPRPSAGPFNAAAVRADFPVLHQRVNGHPLVWLDNGATTQKPQIVIDRVAAFYAHENSNISRSAHTLAANATNAYEDARKTVQRFVNAPTAEEIVFLRGTTEAINLVSQSFGRRFIKAGDEIVLTHAEHHANIVPWYLLAREVGATLKVAPFDDNGEILLDEYEKLLSDRVKIVATTHVANALGTVLPVKAMIEMAHRHGIPVLVDGAQSIAHMPVDVQDLDCDFFVFSGHKVFAPTGIGALYGKKALLDQMPPWQGGGSMIADVTFERIAFQPPPARFEAGTNNIADAIGLAEALKYVERLGLTNINQYEHALLDYATERLARIRGLTIIGKAKENAGVVSFLIAGKEPVEVGKALDQKGIAVRAGHHCAQPILRRYGVEATVRPAFAMYNTFEDADRLVEAVREIAADT